MNCAAKGCAKPVTYEKPLCYPHWLEFDGFGIGECEKCHFFSFEPTVREDAPLCFDCKWDKDVPIHDHAPIEVELRYLYILQLDGGQFYIGQTYDLEARLVEHQQGRTSSTRGRNPELVWFEYHVGDKQGLLEDETEFTLLNKSESGRREILQMILNWQRPLQNVKFLNKPSTKTGNP